eukprot:Gb_09626 [translate_table: standard]
MWLYWVRVLLEGEGAPPLQHEGQSFLPVTCFGFKWTIEGSHLAEHTEEGEFFAFGGRFLVGGVLGPSLCIKFSLGFISVCGLSSRCFGVWRLIAIWLGDPKAFAFPVLLSPGCVRVLRLMAARPIRVYVPTPCMVFGFSIMWHVRLIITFFKGFEKATLLERECVTICPSCNSKNSIKQARIWHKDKRMMLEFLDVKDNADRKILVVPVIWIKHPTPSSKLGTLSIYDKLGPLSSIYSKTNAGDGLSFMINGQYLPSSDKQEDQASEGKGMLQGQAGEGMLGQLGQALFIDHGPTRGSFSKRSHVAVVCVCQENELTAVSLWNSGKD